MLLAQIDCVALANPATKTTMTASASPEEIIVATTIQAVLKNWSDLEVAEALGQELSHDPVIISNLGRQLSQSLKMRSGERSLREAMRRQFSTLLTAQAVLEFHLLGVGSGTGQLQGTVYIFGAREPDFCVSVGALAFSVRAIACLHRMVHQSDKDTLQEDRRLLFQKTSVTPDRTQALYERFAFNGVLGETLDRAGILSALLACYVAQAQIAEREIESVESGNGKKTMQELLCNALCDVLGGLRAGTALSRRVARLVELLQSTSDDETLLSTLLDGVFVREQPNDDSMDVCEL